MITCAWEAVEAPSASASLAEIASYATVAVLFGQRAVTVNDPRESLANLSFYDRNWPIGLTDCIDRFGKQSTKSTSELIKAKEIT